MSPESLQEGAILVADAHCAPWRTPFIDFLKALRSGEIATPQLILMGDIFDLLFGPVTQTHRLNGEGIALLNAVALTTEVIYLEGNHDFRLCDLFPNVKVIPIRNQPYILRYGTGTVALSHGDTHAPWGYRLYTALIRNRLILYVLNRINEGFGHPITRRLEAMMQRKHHCRAIEGFRPMIVSRLENTKEAGCTYTVEGHFHQNQAFEIGSSTYVNVGAFACNERYFVVQSSQDEPLLKEVFFRKEPR